jgi:hypothetical protein
MLFTKAFPMSRDIQSDATASQRTWRILTNRRKLHWSILLLAALFLGICGFTLVGIGAENGWLQHSLRHMIYQRPLRYDVPFSAAVARADKIVVRDGGFDCCRKVDDDKVFFTVTDPVEVRKIASHFQFQPRTTTNSFYETCMCCGSPGIDWYRGNRRIALTAVQHAQGIRWRGFSTARILGIRVGYGDGPLTKESAEWLIGWFDQHGVAGPKKEAEPRKQRAEERARVLEEGKAAAKPPEQSPSR